MERSTSAMQRLGSMVGRKAVGLAVALILLGASTTLGDDGRKIELVDTQGTTYRPLEIAEGELAVLIFILHDCPIANAYAPEIRRITETYAEKRVRFLVIETDPTLAMEQARKHAEEFDYGCPVLPDPEHRLVGHLAVTKAPEAVVVQSGKVRYQGRIDDRYADLGKRRLVLNETNLRDALDALLTGGTVEVGRTEVVGCPIPRLPKAGNSANPVQ